MVNIAIFASGNGSNFENIIQEINEGHVDNALCKVLIVDTKDAYAQERAKRLRIPCTYINPKAYRDKEAYELEILTILHEKKVDLIVLAGYMRFIGKILLANFPNRIINLHPAYLPYFPGAHSIQDAYEAGVAFTGVTVHYVDEGVDTGEIIYQEKIFIDESWSLETLEEHVHAVEYSMFPKVVKKVCHIIESEEA